MPCKKYHIYFRIGMVALVAEGHNSQEIVLHNTKHLEFCRNTYSKSSSEILYKTIVTK